MATRPGTLAVSGGTEGDGITFNGTVSWVQVGDTGATQRTWRQICLRCTRPCAGR